MGAVVDVRLDIDDPRRSEHGVKHKKNNNKTKNTGTGGLDGLEWNGRELTRLAGALGVQSQGTVLVGDEHAGALLGGVERVLAVPLGVEEGLGEGKGGRIGQTGKRLSEVDKRSVRSSSPPRRGDDIKHGIQVAPAEYS